jgi:uncharacterized protein (TIGR03083 family)
LGQAEEETLKKQSIGGYVAARDELDEAIAGLKPTAPCGGWSVIEIAAHIAAWEQYSAELMASLAKGVPEPPVDVDKMNAAIAAYARKAPPNQTMDMYAAGREIFVDSLRELPAAAFQPGPVRDHVKMEQDHCAEHAAELRSLPRA